ncbi:hypothetical protein Csa_021432 [Cucumis sativus]|nr:hypothetical protein Csa_021432 [Cucumis sativus]
MEKVERDLEKMPQQLNPHFPYERRKRKPSNDNKARTPEQDQSKRTRTMNSNPNVKHQNIHQSQIPSSKEKCIAILIMQEKQDHA